MFPNGTINEATKGLPSWSSAKADKQGLRIAAGLSRMAGLRYLYYEGIEIMGGKEYFYTSEMLYILTAI